MGYDTAVLIGSGGMGEGYKAWDPELERIVDTKLGLAVNLGHLGQVEEAEELCDDALRIITVTHGEDHPRTLDALGTRAVILRHKGDSAAAEAAYLELLQKQRQILGPDHPEISRTLNNLAYLLKTQARYGEAEQRYRQALAILDGVYDGAHPNTIQVLQNLASVLSYQEKHDEVEAVLREIVELRRELHPDGSSMIGVALVSGVGRFLMDREDYAEAEPVLREGISIFDDLLGYDHPDPWIARGSLATCLFGLGQTTEAENLTATVSRL